jgi:hypothetical protein
VESKIVKRISLLLLILLAVSLSVHARQTIFVPSCTGTASTDTAAFTALKSAHGSTNPFTIKLPYKSDTTKRCTVNDLTLTANITLDNTDGSGISVVTNKTLTIVGPVINPSGKQVFFNATATLGAVSFANNTSLPTIDPRWWGASGGSDSTAAFQAAQDALPSGGGTIFVAASTRNYLIGAVTITRSNVKIKGAGIGLTVLERRTGATGAYGGIFNVLGLQPANFHIEDLSFDLKRPNYAAGTANSAVFTLRSTYVYVDRVKVVDTSEQFFKFRNSARIYVDHVWCDNAYSDGLEFSFLAGAGDGYSGGASVPTFEYYSVTNSYFADVDIGNFGTSSGTAVTGNANSTLPINIAMRYWTITGNTFKANLRDIHFESQSSGSHFEQGEISGNQSTSAILGSIIVGGVKDFVLTKNTIRNPGLAGSIAITDTAGIILTQSTGQTSERVLVTFNTITDDRASATDYAEYGVKVSAAGSVSVIGNQIKAGSVAAIDIQAVTGRGIIKGNTLVPVATPVAASGIKFTGSGNSGVFSMSGNTATGFRANYSNVGSITNWTTEDRQPPETMVTDIILGDPFSGWTNA